MRAKIEQALVKWALKSKANREELLLNPKGTFERLLGVRLAEGVDVKASLKVAVPPEEELEKMARAAFGDDWEKEIGAVIAILNRDD
jgi:hypothetical protein